MSTGGLPLNPSTTPKVVSEEQLSVQGTEKTDDKKVESKDLVVSGVAHQALSLLTEHIEPRSLIGRQPIPEPEDLRSFFHLTEKLKDLSLDQQQKLFDACCESYRQSVLQYESCALDVVGKYPKTIDFAQCIVQRFHAIIEAYVEAKYESLGKRSPMLEPPIERLDEPKELSVEENRALMQKLKTVGPHPVVTKELMKKLVLIEAFGNPEDAAGSVGLNPLSIEKAVESGNLRELMTLCYRYSFDFLVDLFAKEPELLPKINEKLTGFQLNLDLIEEEAKVAKSEGKKRTDTFVFIKQIPLVSSFRNEEKGRLKRKDTPKAPVVTPLPRIEDVEDLSLREVKVTTKDYSISEEDFDKMKEHKGTQLGQRTVTWSRGQDVYTVNPNTSFYKKAVAMGGLPVVTGPSGTTDGYLHVLKYIGMEDRKEDAMLALIRWMMKSGDHTLHEIRLAGAEYGIEYVPGPKAFETLYSVDPQVVEDIEEEMKKEGFKLPGYYLDGDFQMQMAEKLGLVKPTG